MWKLTIKQDKQFDTWKCEQETSFKFERLSKVLELILELSESNSETVFTIEKMKEKEGVCHEERI